MAAGTIANLVIYEPEFYAGMFESVTQNTEAFNAASANTIRLIQRDLIGHYNKESFFQSISDMIVRRDLTSVSSVEDTPMTQDELIGVKVNRRIGPISQAIGSLQKIGSSQSEMSFILGRMIGEEKVKDLLNTSILAAQAALAGQTALVYDNTGETTATLNHLALVKGLAKFGDAATRIQAWVMHSKPYFDLMGQSIIDKITNVADATIYRGSVATLGKPVIVTDSAALWDQQGSGSAGDDVYSVMGLVSDAVVAAESENENIVSEVVTGLAQLVFRVQGEYAFNLNLKGFKWDTAEGGANPTDTALGTSSNWDKAMTSDKDLAGVLIKVR